MEFVGNKNEVYSSELAATEKYPALKVSEFQSLFNFLSNETEAGILHQATIARIKVHSELLEHLVPFTHLTELSLNRFGDEESGIALYKQAVFALSASALIGIQLSTNATAEAADRQEALSKKQEQCNVQYRQAVDLLIHGRETYCFEMV